MPLAAKKVTISLPEDLLAFADTRASELGTTRSRVIGDLLAERRRQQRDALASEGYRFYAQEAEEFAEASGLAVAEVLADERSSW